MPKDNAPPPAPPGEITEPPAEESPPAGESSPQTPATWDEWLAGQDAAVQHLYQQHTAGLRNALQAERTQRGALARQLREASAQAQANPTLQTTLNETAARLEEAEQRATFFEDAVRPEVGCTNPRLAYLTAKDLEAIDKRGKVDWPRVREAAPELFRRVNPPAPGHAGAGTTSPTPPAGNPIDDYIRGVKRR